VKKNCESGEERVLKRIFFKKKEKGSGRKMRKEGGANPRISSSVALSPVESTRGEDYHI
jgi:hypothetical protein